MLCCLMLQSPCKKSNLNLLHHRTLRAKESANEKTLILCVFSRTKNTCVTSICKCVKDSSAWSNMYGKRSTGIKETKKIYNNGMKKSTSSSRWISLANSFTKGLQRENLELLLKGLIVWDCRWLDRSQKVIITKLNQWASKCLKLLMSLLYKERIKNGEENKP
jgi:hypothetical protein